ncbi:hypothetical protein NW767_007843 [Fusarium falciforme]|nr:hypothetical protein NW767_007843 [Fusarium falciforme]
MCEARSYTHKARFDNFDQALEEEDPAGNRTFREFALSGQVRRVTHQDVDIPSRRVYLQDSTYSADGLLLKTIHGNHTSTEFRYDELSRQLISQKTASNDGGRVTVLEDLTHAYDCVGRCIHTYDASEQTKYFQNTRIEPKREYTYDAIGQLISASGRALLPSTGILSPYNATTGMSPTKGVADSQQVYQYLESYEYDLAGNIEKMTHAAVNQPKASQWTRRYLYDSPSRFMTDSEVQMSNRLTGTVSGSLSEEYGYSGDGGQVGCMTNLPQYSQLSWNFENLLGSSSTQWTKDDTPQTTYYVYDYSGKRVRKVTESFAKAGSPTRKERDTLYLDGLEIQLKFVANDMSQRKITHVTGHELLALVESATGEKTLPRYQTGDNMELDDEGQLISYEEYSPFGAVTYSSMHQEVKASREYRFQRYKHDRETGLYHCGARYYCPWLGRWTSPDPSGDIDGPNLYQYVNNDPINFDDHSGRSRRGISAPRDIREKTPNTEITFLGSKVKPTRRAVGSRDAPPSDSFITSTRKYVQFGGYQNPRQKKQAGIVSNVPQGGLNMLGMQGEKLREVAYDLNQEVADLKNEYAYHNQQFDRQAHGLYESLRTELPKYDPKTQESVSKHCESLAKALKNLLHGEGTSKTPSVRFWSMKGFTYEFSELARALENKHPVDNEGHGVLWASGLDMLKYHEGNARNTAPILESTSKKATKANHRVVKAVGNVFMPVGRTALSGQREGIGFMSNLQQSKIPRAPRGSSMGGQVNDISFVSFLGNSRGRGR